MTDHEKLEAACRAVRLVTGIRKDELLGRRRPHPVARARHFLVHVLASEFNLPHRTIETLMHRTTGTAANSVRQCLAMLDNKSDASDFRIIRHLCWQLSELVNKRVALRRIRI